MFVLTLTSKCNYDYDKVMKCFVATLIATIIYF